MTALFLAPAERARKMQSAILRKLQESGSQVALATAMGVSETTISRFKSEHLEQFCLILAHLGMKSVDASKVCVDREAYESMTYIASKAMADKDISKKLIWEDE
jgi:hypothetical protein